ncbi:hypothetical protein PENTCL1PPCAC_9146 [Pristionchus entomophagus]|uniref:Protein kinase domain-containing protein n=1 Tax=Pristionchus entomophagus TaxID=358040 RepID=A0AAV5SUY2_9BILA|nr:hypothetical protein PENTCL1PPCAC_9146 [Pristionchus entomophagus]
MSLETAKWISSAMAFLEGKSIVHRNLAARNILVGHSLDIIKLAGFSIDRRLENSDDYYSCDSPFFPLKWTAPEAWINHEQHPGKFEFRSCDVGDIQYGSRALSRVYH